MITKLAKLKYLFIVLIVSSTVVSSLTCSKEAKKPKVTGCNSFKYDGDTFSSVGCGPSIRSFDYKRDNSPWFHVECSRGCISSVSLKDKKSSGTWDISKTIVGPDDE